MLFCDVYSEWVKRAVCGLVTLVLLNKILEYSYTYCTYY